MKKVFLFLMPLLAICFMAQAQLTYTLTVDTSFVNLPPDSISHKAKFNIANNTSVATTFEWRVVQSAKPADWISPGICDWNLCYGYNDNSWHQAPMAANSNHDLYIDMKRYVGSTLGCSAVEIEYREQGQTTINTVVLRHTTFADISGCWSLGTKSLVKKDLVSVYPNPANNFINLTINDTKVKSIQLSNIIGKQINRVNIADASSRQQQMSLQGLPSGLYILQFKNAEGKVIGVSRVTKN